MIIASSTASPGTTKINSGYVWLISVVAALGGFVFVYLRVPETKGKSLEQIERELAGPEP